MKNKLAIITKEGRGVKVMYLRKVMELIQILLVMNKEKCRLDHPFFNPRTEQRVG